MCGCTCCTWKEIVDAARDTQRDRMLGGNNGIGTNRSGDAAMDGLISLYEYGMNCFIDSLSSMDGAKAKQCQAGTVTGSEWDIPTVFFPVFFLLEKSNELTRSIAGAIIAAIMRWFFFLFMNCLTLLDFVEG